jgi:WD40 repeat protein
VQSVAFSPDSRHVAAGNLMGEIRVFEIATGEMTATWRTPDFTGWGIIKGHYYTGGVFALAFTPDGRDLYAAGMGSTTDPAAGNGRQLWHRYAWREDPPRKVDETHEGESGRGLMETLTIHPSNRYFVMAGRVQKGNWNAAFFDAESGAVLHTMETKTRVTSSAFTSDGRTLFLGGAVGQERPKDGRSPDFGRLGVYELPLPQRVF